MNEVITVHEESWTVWELHGEQGQAHDQLIAIEDSHGVQYARQIRYQGQREVTVGNDLETIVELMDEHAFMPARNREGDAGLDVRSPVELMLEPGKVARVGLGFRLQLPKDHCALVIERSGHAFKHGIKSVGPLIDPNYRGEVHAQLHNSSDGLVHFNKGDRICQLLIFRYNTTELRQGKVELETVRGTQGMGSSGNV